ncbi:MAG TPA: tetratricopeptide repeat protein [Blastocatellia bacterium]|nr:tetratricopeptide repeat protein [Blastocatellia bacterium]
MKRIALALSLLLCSTPAFAQHAQHDGGARPVVLMDGYGDLRHTVTTRSPEAQRFFDQGLRLVYAFNHEEAVRSFQRAAELDPDCAMAYWGVALALGPNINLDVDPDREKLAYEAIQKALPLAAKVSEPERAYIEALAKRYSNDPKADLKKLNVDYKNAMAEVARRYPDDPDAATFYAESIMLLRPWQYWSADGKPAEGTLELVAVLEAVLKRSPDHIGANHFYIHAVEASPHPEWALPSAQRLKVLTPAAGHLVHMPAHIDIRVGNYEAAARANVYGAQADRDFIKVAGAENIYSMMYYSHNLHFLTIANCMQGRFADAQHAVAQLEAHLKPYLSGPMGGAMLPMLDSFLPTQTIVLARFRKWDEILASPEPEKKLVVTGAMWHFARGLAYVAAGKVGDAENEQQRFAAAIKTIPAEAPYGLNTAAGVFKIAEAMLAGKIAWLKGDKKTAIDLLKRATEAEDALKYDEPADWQLPVRETLGGALLASGDYAAAEPVFRAELERNPRSGRALFGLMESLKGQGKQSAAAFVQAELDAAWKNADVKLRLQDL